MNLDWWTIKAQGTQLGVKMWDNRDVDPTPLIVIGVALLLLVVIVLLVCIRISSKQKTKLGTQINTPQEETKLQEENNKDNLAVAQLKILSMLEDGKITPHECGDLLAALIDKKNEPSVESGDSTSSNVHQTAASINDGD